MLCILILGPFVADIQKVTAFRLGFLIYAVTCSGPYGLEEMVSVSGPGLTLALLVGLAVVYAAPIAFVCAELTARYPVEGGYYRWVRAAFGDLPGYLAAWLAWLTMYMANAAFAVNFTAYLGYLVPGLEGAVNTGVSIALVWLATGLNCRGIHVVGAVAVVLTCLLLAPTVILIALALVHTSNDPFVPFAHPGKPFSGAVGDGLLIALYMFGGFEKLTLNAGEVQDPRRAFKVALAVVVPTCALTFLLPTLAALAVAGDWTAWGEGHFAVIAERVGGAPLGAAMAVGGMLSNVCLLMVTTLAQSRLPLVLAQDGMFPARLAGQHPRHGTPVPALVLGGVILTPLCMFSFAELAGLYSQIQVLAYVLIYAALFKLRAASSPGGSNSAPLSAAAVAALAFPTVVLAALVVGGNLSRAQGGTASILGLALLASGPLTYLLFRRTCDASGR